MIHRRIKKPSSSFFESFDKLVIWIEETDESEPVLLVGVQLW